MIISKVIQISLSALSMLLAVALFKHYYQTFPEGFGSQYFRINALIAISAVMVVAPDFINDNRKINFIFQAIGLISLATLGYFAFIYQ